MPIAPNSIISTDGSVVSAAPSPVIVSPSPSQFFLPEIPQVKRTNLNEAGIETLLNTLFDNWPAARTVYGQYPLLLPTAPLDLTAAGVSGNLLTQPTNTVLLYKPYNLNQSAVGVPLMIPQQLAAADPFKPLCL